MKNIGILAYGSLIEDPGVEITPLIVNRISDVDTPFKIEFARKSSTRSNAPTLVCVNEGGSSVKGTILVLNSDINLSEAESLLWRRETRKENSNLNYTHPTNPTKNTMIVEHINNFYGLSTVLFTKLGANIEHPTGDALADLAIASAKDDAGQKNMDGISYLISVKRQGISTPLMKSYEIEIIKKTNCEDLESALIACKSIQKS